VPGQYGRARGIAGARARRLDDGPAVFYICAMALVGPPPAQNSSLRSALLGDLRDERAASVPFPPGETSFSLARTRRIETEPLPVLLQAYERFGPIFTLRLLHGNVVFMLGPAANHYVLVSDASNFTWRDGHFRDLIALMGDGLLTIDGEFHRRSRRIMLPAFHREHLEASVDTVLQEASAAVERLTQGMRLDLYAWTRRLALRVAMRALFGLDPDGERARAIDAAGLFETALSFYSTPYYLRVLRGRRSPWAAMRRGAHAGHAHLLRDIRAARARGARPGHPQPPARRPRRGRQPPQRRSDPR
jgi:cytochrome P450